MWQTFGKRKRGKPQARWKDSFGKMLTHNLFERIVAVGMPWARLGEVLALFKA